VYAKNPTDRPRLALISDVREMERRFVEWQSAERAFMASAPVQALLDRLTSKIESERSVAATYRLVKDLGRYHYYTYGTFNRHWKGAPAWVNESIRSEDTPAVLKLLGENDAELISEAARIAELWNGSQEPVPEVKKSE